MKYASQTEMFNLLSALNNAYSKAESLIEALRGSRRSNEMIVIEHLQRDVGLMISTALDVEGRLDPSSKKVGVSIDTDEPNKLTFIYLGKRCYIAKVLNVEPPIPVVLIRDYVTNKDIATGYFVLEKNEDGKLTFTLQSSLNYDHPLKAEEQPK